MLLSFIEQKPNALNPLKPLIFSLRVIMVSGLISLALARHHAVELLLALTVEGFVGVGLRTNRQQYLGGPIAMGGEEE
jgi:hypothetical protein